MQCRATIAKITYRTNVGRIDGYTIPLGMLLELRTGPKSGFLILLARERLKKAEYKQMDWVAQNVLINPAEFFKSEIGAALEDGAEGLLSRLSEKFIWSVHVTAPTEVPLPDEIALQLTNSLTKAVASMKGNASTKDRPDLIEDEDDEVPSDALMSIAGPEFPREGARTFFTPPAFIIGSKSSDGRVKH